jgi:ABC-type multidrug transport system ATPase subunit
MMNRAEHAIVVETAKKRYGNLLAVNGVSFTVREGEVFAFLRPTAPQRLS